MAAVGLTCALVFGNNVYAAQDTKAQTIELLFKFAVRDIELQLRDRALTYQLTRDYSKVSADQLPTWLRLELNRKHDLIEQEFKQLVSRSFNSKNFSYSTIQFRPEFPAMKKYFLKKYSVAEYQKLIEVLLFHPITVLTSVLPLGIYEATNFLLPRFKGVEAYKAPLTGQVFSARTNKSPLEALKIGFDKQIKPIALIQSDEDLKQSMDFQLTRLVHSSLTNALFSSFAIAEVNYLDTEFILGPAYAQYLKYAGEKPISKSDALKLARKLKLAYFNGEVEFPSFVAYFCEEGMKQPCNYRYVENIIHLYKLLRAYELQHNSFTSVYQLVLNANYELSSETYVPHASRLRTAVKQYNENIRALFEDPLMIRLSNPKKTKGKSK